ALGRGPSRTSAGRSNNQGVRNGVRTISLDDKYTLGEGTAFMTGVQALVRLPMEQIRRDRAAGLKTGAFISGYPGSPLGGYDLALMQAGRHLAEPGIRFVPGLNEQQAAAHVLASHVTERVRPSPD